MTAESRDVLKKEYLCSRSEKCIIKFKCETPRTMKTEFIDKTKIDRGGIRTR